MANATAPSRRTTSSRCCRAIARCPASSTRWWTATAACAPHWQPLLAMLAGLGPQEIGRRFAAADRHLRDSGVFYRVYEDSDRSRTTVAAEPLAAADRRLGMAGAQSRADPARRTARGGAGRRLWAGEARARGPAARPSSSPAIRNSCGRWSASRRAGGAHLRFYAVDVGRSPDGHWWVLGDRTQAPSGAGYALENRLALSRAMPDVYRELRSSAWRRSSRRSRPSCPRSIGRTIRESACSRRGR